MYDKIAASAGVKGGSQSNLGRDSPRVEAGGSRGLYNWNAGLTFSELECWAYF